MKKSIFVLSLISFLFLNNSCSNSSGDSLVSNNSASNNQSNDSYIPSIPDNLNCGASILFGHYEQDGDTSNGKEQIKWLIVDKNSSGKYLIVAEKILDTVSANSTNSSTTWENSTVRSFLNGYGSTYNASSIDYRSNNFINNAFTTGEISLINLSSVTAHSNPTHGTSSGNATSDKIFLLSLTEVLNYYTSNTSRIHYPTAYAKAKGISQSSPSSGGVWYLRTCGSDATRFATVNSDGSSNNAGVQVTDNTIGLVPAMWIN